MYKNQQHKLYRSEWNTSMEIEVSIGGERNVQCVSEREVLTGKSWLIKIQVQSHQQWVGGDSMVVTIVACLKWDGEGHVKNFFALGSSESVDGPELLHISRGMISHSGNAVISTI